MSSPETASTRESFVFRRSGIGDDLMVFWSSLALVLMDEIQGPISIFFERESVRHFLRTIVGNFPEVEFLDEPPCSVSSVKVRLYGKDPHTPTIREVLKMWWKGSERYACPYHHKLINEYGNGWRPSFPVRLGRCLGVISAWEGTYPEIYDGLQEWGVVLDYSQQQVGTIQERMRTIWRTLRDRCRRADTVCRSQPVGPLFFPGAGSFQDFGPEFVDTVKKVQPEIEVARYVEDPRPADVRYQGLSELRSLISSSEQVVTNDSLSSHIAQFFAKNHILLASWARPATVCFPGAENTSIVDLGYDLSCRPCAYYPLDRGRCPAGFHRCVAQEKLNGNLRDRLDKAGRNGARQEQFR